jgi:putative peptidoglycan lipid II flippase
MYLEKYPIGLSAYTVAFTIPDFMYFLLVSGALSVSFIPVFNQRLASGNKESAWRLSSSLMNFMALVTMVASVLIIIFAEPLVHHVVAPGLDESGRALAVSLMRVIAVNPFLFAIATVIASMQQAVGRFVFYAMAPMIYNIGIIIGALFFTDGITLFGWRVFDGGIMGVALGVVLGSVMQLIVSAWGLRGLGFDYEFKIRWKHKGFRQVLKLLPARSLDQGLDYVNGLVETRLASYMADVTIRAYQQALTISLLPVNLIGVSIANAYFPKMTVTVAEGNRAKLIQDLRSVIRMMVWIILPIAIITFFGRGYLANFLDRQGNVMIANVIGALVVSIVFRTIYHILARVFYANQDTKTPLYVSVFSIGFNIVLALLFTMYFHFGVFGLAWAQSIMALVEVGILVTILSRRIQGLFDSSFVRSLFIMLGATGVTALVTYLCVRIFPLLNGDESIWTTFPKFALVALISGAAYVWISKLFKIEESAPVIRRIHKILYGRAGVKSA